MTRVHLNSDLDEGCGTDECCGDAASLDVVASANVACGLHASDPGIMARTFALAGERGVAVGARPGFPDLWSFGRCRMPFNPPEIERSVACQDGSAQALAACAGHRITAVTAHGALANVAAEDRSVTDAIARAVQAVDRDLALLATALTAQVPEGAACGLDVHQEVFADRGYTEESQLIERSKPGALLTDAAADRVLRVVEAGTIITAEGRNLPTAIRSRCVHGDSAHAVATARTVGALLVMGGVTLAPVCT